MDSEIDIQRATSGMQHMLSKLAALAGGLATMALVIGIATFATGFDADADEHPFGYEHSGVFVLDMGVDSAFEGFGCFGAHE